MALTYSTMLPLGTQAPAFTLLDTVSGEILSLEDIKSNRGTVIMFICNHCPYVKHYEEELVRISTEYQKQGIAFVAISSNDVDNYPDDSPEKMKQNATQLGYPFAYLYDETQEVARAYQAQCTPEFYLFDGELKCVYRGRLDASSPGNDAPIDGADIRAALECLLTNKPISENQHPSMGCNIKWK